jgi:integrase
MFPMSRTIERLSPAGVAKAKKPGMYADGAGLWLHVGPTVSPNGKTGRSWIFRFMLNGRAREMGLGPLHTISLGEAREKARDARKLILMGLDPLDAKTQQRNAQRLDAAKAITFRACAERYIADHRAGWRNAKHADQWANTLATYAYPIIGNLGIGAIDTGLITKILKPIWATKSETASRVRGRIEAILDYAATHHWRDGPNPARWRGHLEHVLPKKSKVAKVKHHEALGWEDIGPFMVELARQDGIAALALRFAILTAGRTGEVIGARWDEINTKAALWAIPADRMKASKEHRVPLSEDALAVLREAATHRQGDEVDAFVFPGGKRGASLSNMAMLALLGRMKRYDLTTHGFRSTFRDWAAETGRPADIAEAALAHVVGDKTVAAYQRGDLLERRRRLMSEWAAHCNSRPAIVQLRREGATS